MLPRSYFARDAAELARALIGATLLVDGVGGVIVETEAYEREDPASHSFGGKTNRNAAMFGPAGHAYVYRSYGIHWCLNAVCGRDQTRSAVLIRALEPRAGLMTMRARRGLEDVRKLCAGPRRLCEALAISQVHDGLPLDEPPVLLPRSINGRGGHCRAADRHHTGNRDTLALWSRRVALLQPAVPRSAVRGLAQPQLMSSLSS